MARTVEKTLYTFAELDDDAKEKARDWYRDDAFDFDWYESTLDDAKRCGELLGIDIDRIYFSGFWSQGDGACFEGDYRYRKGWRKALRAEVGGDDLPRLEAIGEALQSIQRRAFYGVTASCRQSGHYMHSGCMAVNVDAGEHPAGGYWNDISGWQEDTTDALRDFADWIYSALEKEFEFLNSEEIVDEALEANEYEFDEFGAIV